MSVRTGIGYDVHRLEPGRRLVLGGVELASDVGLAGHSDADVLTHAVMDALLGAAGLGDIGMLFPDSDPDWTDADSIALLRDVAGRVAAQGYGVVSVDATLVLERPRIGDRRDEMRARLADALGVELADVNVKATTGEGIGFVGRGEGAAAIAVATLESK
jgi:2-C-methyl-D-erythritol 2,4-cyclodiphosphate synthase